MQEVEEKRALPKTLDYCLLTAMSLLSFHFSRGTNGKGSWFIVWLRMHWKELNFPSEDCQNTKNQSAFGVGKSWSSLLPIIHMEHGLWNSRGWQRTTPAEDGQWVGPRPWLSKELALLTIGWAERAQLHGGEPCPSLRPHKGTSLGLHLSEVLEKDPHCLVSQKT